MGLNYVNLDEVTRPYMLAESKMGGHYVSKRLTAAGQSAWASLMEAATEFHTDVWLSMQLLSSGHLLDYETYLRSGITRTRRVNVPQAAEQLAEGEFNRYYLRGLCVRALSSGIPALLVYRGKAVMQPRPESEAKIGTFIDAASLLATLRVNDFTSIENYLAIPGGPNSGITARLP